jgi:TPR repeat protein
MWWGARAAYQVALDSGDAQWAPAVDLLLGELETGPEAGGRHRERAAASGDVQVLVSLAELYAADGGISTARHLLEQAGRGENDDAARYLPFLADDPAVPEDAVELISAGAEAGDTDSMAFLGLHAFRNGDEDRARDWWTRPAAEGDIIAPLLLKRLHQVD